MKFETHVIEWLKESTISGVSRRLGLNWKSVSLIMERAVARGQARRQSEQPRHLCVDETSFQKRHEYVTVVTDADSGAVQWVSDNRTVDSLAGYFAQLPAASLHGIATVSMDMWSPYVKATRDHLPSADTKICFDRFHVQRMILEAVDRVRKVEHAGFRSTGHSLLTGTKYWWLTNPANLSRTVKTQLQGIRTVAMRTARAWRLKEAASLLWHYASRTWAVKAWRAWIAWARRSKLDPIKRVAITIRQHLWGILNAVIHGVSNGRAESANSKIQLVKSRARGYRSRIRFRTAIMFYCGQLDLLPRTSA
jgi:transposase